MPVGTRTPISIAAIALALSAPVAAACAAEPVLPARLDLETALRLVRERGFDLLLADAQVASARGDLAAARGVANPTVGVSYGRSFDIGGCATPGACPSYPAALGASVSDSAALADALTGKRGLRLDVARAALGAAERSRDDALRTVESSVKQQYVQVLLAGEALAFAREAAGLFARTQELMRARYEAGAISEADLARVDTARLGADQAVDSAASILRTARVGLAFLLGVRGPVPDFEVVVDGLGGSAVPGRLAAETRESLVARALASRPDVLAARRQVARSEAALALARRQRIPDVSLQASYAQQGTGAGSVTPPTVTFGLSLPLPIFYQQQGEIRRAEADLSTQQVTLGRAEASAVQDVETAWAGYTSARALLVRMEGGLLDRARTALDLVTIQYRKGAASLLDLLDAQRTWISTRTEYIQDRAGYWTAVFKLEQAAGVPLR